MRRDLDSSQRRFRTGVIATRAARAIIRHPTRRTASGAGVLPICAQARHRIFVRRTPHALTVIPGEARPAPREGNPGVETGTVLKTWIPFPRARYSLALTGDDIVASPLA